MSCLGFRLVVVAAGPTRVSCLCCMRCKDFYMGYFGGSTILALGVQGLGLGDGFECRVSGFAVYLLAPLKGFRSVHQSF